MMNDYQKFIAYSRYSRWLEEEGRRETWEDICERYMDWMDFHLINKYGFSMEKQLYLELMGSIKDLDVMPSMRCMMTAGPALDRTHVAGYNCAYLPVDSLRSFDETMYILMCGTGVGFSVERKYIEQLPKVGDARLLGRNLPIVVEDSKEGWAIALRQVIAQLYSGIQPKWDTSGVRPAGARLKTFGGRASGPGPLEELFVYVSELIEKARGRQLTSLECHDIMCKIAEVVVVGGVRRSAMISLSDLNSEEMRHSKHGSWWINDPQRGLSNNSAVYMGKPTVGQFLREWHSLYDSNAEYLIALQVLHKLEEMDEEISIMTLAQIRAVRSFFDRINSAISLRSLYDLTMTLAPWNAKCDWPPLLGPFNPLSLSLNISGISGGVIQKKNVYLAYRLPESSTTQSSDEMVKVVGGWNTFGE
jgi:ribonucleoside-triphosphate reductase